MMQRRNHVENDSLWPDVAKTESSLMVVFIPSVDREGHEIDQEKWVSASLEFFGINFAGATAYPRGRGVWRDDERGGILIYDQPILLHCYTRHAVIKACSQQLHEFLVRMGTETQQGAVGIVIDDEYMEIRFPLR